MKKAEMRKEMRARKARQFRRIQGVYSANRAIESGSQYDRDADYCADRNQQEEAEAEFDKRVADYWADRNQQEKDDAEWLSSLLGSDLYSTLQLYVLKPLKLSTEEEKSRTDMRMMSFDQCRVAMSIANDMVTLPQKHLRRTTAINLMFRVAMIEQHAKEFCRCRIFHVINEIEFWGLPCPRSLRLIQRYYDRMWRHQGPARVVDMGCGTGAWTILLDYAGVRVLPVEASADNPRKEDYVKQYCFPYDSYEQLPGDILLIVWGRNEMKPLITDFVENGGNVVIIQGEASDGCTLDTHMPIPGFDLVEEVWTPTMIQYPMRLGESICAHVRKGFQF
jgi:SAM-dependent methyltransferase